MNKAQKKWVDALESGKYRQGSGVLYRDGKHTPFGVACEEILGGTDWHTEDHPTGMKYNVGGKIVTKTKRVETGRMTKGKNGKEEPEFEDVTYEAFEGGEWFDKTENRPSRFIPQEVADALCLHDLEGALLDPETGARAYPQIGKVYGCASLRDAVMSGATFADIAAFLRKSPELAFSIGK